MKIQIICKGSTRDGLGHLFRTNTFASEAHKKHQVEVVAIIEPELESLFSGALYKVCFVREDQMIPTLVSSFKPELVLFDMLSIDDEVFWAISGYTLSNKFALRPPLKVSLSPVFSHMDKVDILFTRAITRPEIPGVRVFNGLEYTIFSQHCIKIDDQTYNKNLQLPQLSISISMGGTDASNKTLKILEKLSELDIDLTILVMLGEGYAHCYNTLASTLKNKYHHEVILAKTNRSMWTLMGNSVLGIFAGGLTTMEGIYTGLPSINLIEKENNSQIQIIKELESKGYCIEGDYFTEDGLSNLSKTIIDLNNNRHKLSRVREIIQNLLDQSGSSRILEQLEKLH